ncbi:MAG: hypothetical protein QF745_08755, partial [Planctomycetota bacterium]|nr:hypothetical protein [Planctomycetota bacterium]
MNSGKFNDAITIAEMVASENQGSVVQLEANNMMSAAIAAAPANEPIDLGILYAAAEGAYWQKEFLKAREGFLLLLGRLQGSRQADDYGAGAYYFLGRAYTYLDQRLEATVTHQIGFELFPDDDDYASKNAEAWMKLSETLRSSAPGDAFLDQYWKTAVNAVASSSSGGAPDQARWTAANSDYQQAKDKAKIAKRSPAGSIEASQALDALDAAIQSYKGIKEGSRYFEKAKVQTGMCLFRKMAWDDQASEEAFEYFENYLEVYIPNPENTPQDARGRKTRKDASAQADFYRGQVRYKQAKEGDVAHWPEVLNLYNGFTERHPDQKDYAAAAFVSVLEAHLALGNEEQAIATWEILTKEGYPDSRIAQSSHYLYSWYLIRAEEGEETDFDALGKAANYLGFANSHVTRQNWQNLVKEARLRLELDEPSHAADILEKTLAKFAEDSTFSELQRFHARMDLVDAYLTQGNTAEAGPIIEKLLAEKPKNLRVMQAAVKVLAGWPVATETGRVKEIPGLDTTEDFTRADKLLADLTALAENAAKEQEVSKFSLPDYWNARLQLAYLLYKRSKIDSAY